MTSRWERDTRPALDCTVCDEPADRSVDLPHLPDVHVAFAHPALCETCLAVAAAGDQAALTARARDRWPDDRRVADDLVRLVLAAAGHRVAPPASASRPRPAPLSRDDLQVWQWLEPRIYGQSVGAPVVRGTVDITDDHGRCLITVWRDGPQYRLDDEDGPRMLSDGVTAWSRHRDGERGDHGELGMVSAPYSRPGGGPPWVSMAFHRSRHDVDLFGFGTPIGPIEATEFLGRRAYRFAFAAPPHKPADMHVVIDAETGLTLEERFGDWSLAGWTQFETGVPVDASFFVWDGPTVDLAALRAEQERKAQADMAERASWFAEHVAANLTLIGEQVEVMLHEWDEDGAFEASLDGRETDLFATIARRPRADERWSLHWHDVTDRWSDERWDWALQLLLGGAPAPLDEAQLADLRRQLGS